eukprot:2075737-Alexandrium_andersonii.AAC.1
MDMHAMWAWHVNPMQTLPALFPAPAQGGAQHALRLQAEAAGPQGRGQGQGQPGGHRAEGGGRRQGDHADRPGRGR